MSTEKRMGKAKNKANNHRKLGRPIESPSGEVRDFRTNTRLSQSERRKIERAAKRAGIPVAEFLRRAALKEANA